MKVLNTSSDRPQDAAREAYDYMANHVARFNCLQALLVVKHNISKRLAFLKANKWCTTQETVLYPFPFLIDLIIRNCTTMDMPSTFTELELMHLIDKYVNYPEALLFCQKKDEGQRLSDEFKVKMSFEQLPYQEGKFSLFPRAHLLFGQVPEELSRDYPNDKRYQKFIVQRDTVLEDVFQLSLDDILVCVAVLNALSIYNQFLPENPRFEIPRLKEFVDADRINILAQHLTISRDDYRNRPWSCGDDHVSRKYDSFPIFKFPIIEVQRRKIAPFPNLIAERVTKLLYKDFYDFYEAEGKLAEFGGLYGDIFKNYVGILLKGCFGAGRVLDLDKIMPGHGPKRADRIVIRGGLALLFECKILRYCYELRNTGSLDLLAELYEDNVLPALAKQCAATEAYIRNGRCSNPDLKSIKDFYYIVVTEDHFELANAVEDYLTDQILVKKLNSYKWQLMSLLDLEVLESSSLHDDIQAVFVDKWCNPEARKASFQQHISIRGGKRRGNSLIEKKFRELFHLPDNWHNDDYPLHQ